MGRPDTLSRRELLRGLVGLSAATAAHLLTGCGPAGTPTATPVDEPAGDLQDPPTVTPPPTATPRPTVTPTPIVDAPLWDPSVLTPVYVAHDTDGTRGYPGEPPFDPDTAYPDVPYTLSGTTPQNGAYHLVREALRLFQPAGFGQAEWNPLEDLIHPGDRVLIKPNLVDASVWTQGQMTHPAILRPIIDYAYKACGPTGQIMVGDGPWSVDVFDPLVDTTGIRTLVQHLTEAYGIPVILQDLNAVDHETTPLVDLGALSALHAEPRTWYDAHGEVLAEGGDPGIGSYRISPPVLEADVVISVPKAKVHCSGGITVAMKNMIGIIPAWDGAYGDGVLKECAHTSDVDRAAGKRGLYLDNDTIWRSMADLNRIVRYADKQGTMQTHPQRRTLVIVDALVAAEASQYDPHPYPLNTVILGADPIAVDAVTARCMGFDPQRLKSVVQPARRTELPLGVADPAQIRVRMTNGDSLATSFRQSLTPERYVYSWEGHLEATDFDPPGITDWQWEAGSGHLHVSVEDAAGVAWVRVHYDYQGERRVKALAMREGNPHVGHWSVPFPLGAEVREVRLEMSDRLFNTREQSVTW